MDPAAPHQPRIVATDIDDPVARGLERRLFDDLAGRYPDEGLTFSLGDAVCYRHPNGGFFVAWLGDTAVGCAGLKGLGNGVGELKRLWVDPSVRRIGIARALTAAREDLARKLHLHMVVLETGWNQPEQLAHAAANGYQRVDPWDTEFPYDQRVAYLGKRL